MFSRRYALSGPSGPNSNNADNRYADEVEDDLKRHLDPDARRRLALLPNAVRFALLANISDGLVSVHLIARQLNDPDSTLDDLSW